MIIDHMKEKSMKKLVAVALAAPVLAVVVGGPTASAAPAGGCKTDCNVGRYGTGGVNGMPVGGHFVSNDGMTTLTVSGIPILNPNNQGLPGRGHSTLTLDGTGQTLGTASGNLFNPSNPKGHCTGVDVPC
jgi:hypothetical protein